MHANFLPGPCHVETFPAAGIQRIEIYLGDGNDHAQIAGNITLPVLIDGGAGNDHLNAGGGPAMLLGGDGNDFLIGSRTHDLIYGGAGNDVLLGLGGNDILDGGAGNDKIMGGRADSGCYHHPKHDQSSWLLDKDHLREGFKEQTCHLDMVMHCTLDVGEWIVPALPSNGNGKGNSHHSRNNGNGKAMQFGAMIFDDHSGGLVGQKQYESTEGRKETRLRFDPAAWTVTSDPVIDRKDEWIVEL